MKLGAFLFVLILVSAVDANKVKRLLRRHVVLAGTELCTPTNDYRMVFPERTSTNYALKENAITHGLNAVTLCFFAKDNPPDNRDDMFCPYSYAVPGSNNELTFCTSPKLRAFVNGARRIANISIDDEHLHHICFTWKSSDGGYQFYKDGKLVASGMGLKTGYTIQPAGDVVLGQGQDYKIAADFNLEETFVGELTELNVWDKVLPESDIVAQHLNCHIGKGSVNWWSQFEHAVHGEVEVVEGDIHY